MKKELVSVIIPTFKRDYMLNNVLKSIDNQTHKELEILIIDDNFKDSQEREKTEKEVLKLKEKYYNLDINYIKHEDNMGANSARNTGIDYSKGKYITFLDDDDLFVENRIEIMIEKLKENNADMVCCSCRWIQKETDEILRDISIASDKIVQIEDILTNNIIGGTSLILLKKEVLVKIGKFDTKLSSCQDWDLYIRIALAGYKILKIKNKLVNYYIHKGERISNNREKVLQGHLKIKNKYKIDRQNLSLKRKILFSLKILKQYLKK